jgi:tetratricopeptide (TPR) repeat protein/tRNA A-37 threonylcarbamoyl transferase component Bud32
VLLGIDRVCDRFLADWKQGYRPRLEDYLGEMAENYRSDLFRHLFLAEIEYRRSLGETPAEADYRDRFPEQLHLIATLVIQNPHDGSTPLAALDIHSTPIVAHEPKADSDSPPQLPPRYQITRLLGRGGMGEVWLGRDCRLRRRVAVKVVQERWADKESVLRRFVEEAQLTSQLQHPGIPPVFERSALPDGRPYFCMKVVRGSTLQELLENRAGPSDDLPRFLAIFEQVCQAVAYAHSKSVIHRDLKPQNVMVGAFGEVQVMDWGLAKVLGEELPAAETAAPAVSVVETDRTEQPDSVTVPGTVMGTYAYMSPEQARGDVQLLDRRCDVFGLGAILCEILTGSSPYTGTGDEVKRQAQNGDTHDALTRLYASTAGQELIALARSCLSPQIADRPVNADAVATAVTAYLAAVQERLRVAEVARAAAAAREEEAKATAAAEGRARMEAQSKAAAERRAKWLMLGLGAAMLLVTVAIGGSGWWLQKQHAEAMARRMDSDRLAVSAIEKAREALADGWEKHDIARLKESLADAKKAVEVARSDDVLAEAQSLLSEAEEKTRQAQKNHKLLTALLNIVEPFGKKAQDYQFRKSGRLESLVDQRDIDFQFWWAFRDWGVVVVDENRIIFNFSETKLTERVVERLGAQPAPVVQEIVASLDKWAALRRAQRPEVEWRRLNTVADQLDIDPRSKKLRGLRLSGALEQERKVAGAICALAPWLSASDLRLGPHARELREMAARLDPAREPVLGVIALAQGLEEVGDRSAAERVLRAALAKRPGEVVLLDSLGKFLQRQHPPRLGEAIECYRAARAVRPELRIALSTALAKAGRWLEAQAIVGDLLKKESDDPDVLEYLGSVLHDQYRLEEAVAAFQKAITVKPADAELYHSLGDVLSDQNKSHEAEDAYRKAIAIKPDFVDAYSSLGHVLRHQNKLDEAVKTYRKGIELKPDNASAYDGLGIALSAQEKLVEAENAFRKLTQLFPGYTRGHVRLGNVLRNQQKLSEAVSAFREALKIDPSHAWAYNCLGLTLSAQNKLDDALVEYRNAIKFDRNYGDAYFNLGNTLYIQQKYDDAVDAYRETIRIEDDDAWAHYRLGNALCHLQKMSEALGAYGKANTLLPDNLDFRIRLHRAQKFLQLNEIFLALMSGRVQPHNEQERVEFAELCYYKQHYLTATRNYAAAFAAEPKIADDLSFWDRYNAACAAALAAARRGEDAKTIGIEECARLRQHALEWLRADLTACAKLVEKGDKGSLLTVESKLEHWQRDRDLTAVRDKDSLSAVPKPERERWQKLWTDVNALLEQATKKRLQAVRWFDWRVSSSTNALARRSTHASSPI